MYSLSRDETGQPQIVVNAQGVVAVRVYLDDGIIIRPLPVDADLQQHLPPEEWQECLEAAGLHTQTSATDPPRAFVPPPAPQVEVRVQRGAGAPTEAPVVPVASTVVDAVLGTVPEKAVEADPEAEAALAVRFAAAQARLEALQAQQRQQEAAQREAEAARDAEQHEQFITWLNTGAARAPAFCTASTLALPDLFDTALVTWFTHRHFPARRLGEDGFKFDCTVLPPPQRQHWQDCLLDATYHWSQQTGWVHPLAGAFYHAEPEGTPPQAAHPSNHMALFAGVLHELGTNPPNVVFCGELNGRGSFLPLKHPLAVAAAAKATGKYLFVPEASAPACLSVYARVIGVADAVALSKALIDWYPSRRQWPLGSLPQTQEISRGVDLSCVAGQEGPKRALEIAVAGGHDILLIGPPGEGKSLLASTIPTIAPVLTPDERLEVAAIYQAAGLLPGDAVPQDRIVRTVSGNISKQALLGGGSAELRPGEITLAHLNYLYFDEFLQCSRNTLEELRGPLQEGRVVVSRTNWKTVLPAKFQLVAAMNPCPCGGWLPDGGGTCTCTKTQRRNYAGKMSGPLCDRLEIRAFVGRSFPAKWSAPGECSAVVRERIRVAALAQRQRYKGTGIASNARVGAEWEGLCRYTAAADRRLRYLAEKTPMSNRAGGNLIRVAQTIADLECAEVITEAHLDEAETLMITPLPKEQ